MSGIALILVGMGHDVTGTDVVATAVVPRLVAAGVQVEIVAAAELFSNAKAHEPDLVAHSTAFPPSSADVVAAREQGIEVFSRAEILAGICANRRTVAVSGTHGKTTTSSMLAKVLVDTGHRPSYLIGGELRDLGDGAVWDEGEWFVVEADESDGTFVVLGAEIAVVTSVEADHLDHYGTMAEIEQAFGRFLAEAPGPNVVCLDEPNAARLGAARSAITYGTGEGADYRIEDPSVDRSGVTFLVRGPPAVTESNVRRKRSRYGPLAHEVGPVASGAELAAVSVRLQVPGLYNARNATAAVATAAILGVPVAEAAKALAGYGGVVRRFEQRGSAFGASIVDDYAHNPGKVAAVLAAARAGAWDRIVAVFQPHRFSRTAALSR
ncbi:MAG: Mur ligase family protein, partial [Actinomycetota bacterium]|nr:Mur ligase family protein [Actinomycetota bacterium]